MIPFLLVRDERKAKGQLVVERKRGRLVKGKKQRTMKVRLGDELTERVEKSGNEISERYVWEKKKHSHLQSMRSLPHTPLRQISSCDRSRV